jgi:hypothetical protein
MAPLHNGQTPNGVWKLEICDAKANDKGKLRAFGLVFASLNCPAPDATVYDITIQSASVSWSPILPADSILIEYGPAGYFPGQDGLAGKGGISIVVPAAGVQPVLIDDLQPLQWYELYVRKQCAPGIWGENAPVRRFYTSCPPTMAGHFDSLALCPNGCADPCPLTGLWQNVPGDDYEWKVRTGAGLTYPTAGPPAASGGSGNYLYFRNSCSPTGANGKKAILRSLCVQVVAPAGTPCHFAFDLYMNTKTGQMGSLLFQASTDGGQSWTTVKTWSGNRGKRWRREYVALDQYNGQIALFQFIATGVFGAYGDIAIDEIAFYGSIPAGTPDYVFYRDGDGDGFGTASQRIVSCLPVAPAGYVSVDGDCDDGNASVYPGATEILCNHRDENCNGLADDSAIPAPIVPAVVAVCSGEDITLSIPGIAVGQYYWFDSPASGSPMTAGSVLVAHQLQQSAVYYVIDSVSTVSGGCASARTIAPVLVNPSPRLFVPPHQSLCQGRSFDLSTLAVVDSAKTNSLMTWYSSWPPGVSNKLLSTVVVPTESADFYVTGATTAGCIGSGSVHLSVQYNPIADILQGDSIPACRGKSVLLTAQGTGGASPYHYMWSNGLNLANIPIQSYDNPDAWVSYTVTLTDANGCTSAKTAHLQTLNSISTVGIVSVKDPSVCGGSDGRITLNPLDGNPPYTYIWSGPTTGSQQLSSGIDTIGGLMPGGYRVTVHDATGICSLVLPFIVLNAPGLNVTLDTIIQPVCPGVSSGVVSLHVSGTDPVIHWNDGQTTAVATHLSAGSYSVTISDGGCARVLEGLEVKSPPPIQVVRNGQQDISCFGTHTGSIELAVFGGTPPYSYVWSDGSTAEDLDAVAAGAYRATVADSKGCKLVSPDFTVVQPAGLQVKAAILHKIACFGEKSAHVSAFVSGGMAPYHIQWSTGADTPEVAGLGAGTYTVTVSDLYNCSATAEVMIAQPLPLALDKILQTDPTCAGIANGRIEVQITGGEKPYRFVWNTGQLADTTAILDNRDAGVYGITITDAAGCQLDYGAVALTAPQLLSLTLDSLIPVHCYGESTGLIAVGAGGTVGQVQYLWNGTPGGSTITGIPAGTYEVEVSDSRQCAIRQTFEVLQPQAAFYIGLLTLTNAWCFGEPNGGIDVQAGGGTGPYQFEWSTGQTTEDLVAIPAGTYSLLAHDAWGCYALLQAVSVSEPPPISVKTDIQPIPCFGAHTGSIALSVSGGVPPFVYAWNTGEVKPGLYDLPKGTYKVTIQDHTGCAVVLDSLQVLDQGAAFGVQVDEIRPVSCPGGADGLIRVTVQNGTGPYQFLWSPPVGLHPGVAAAVDAATGLSGGGYVVTVVDAAGCHAETPVILVEESPDLIATVDPHAGCCGNAAGSISSVITGGLPPYQYQWSTGATTSAVTDLPPGVYGLTVSDFRGCMDVVYPIVLEAAGVHIPGSDWTMDLHPNPAEQETWLTVHMPSELEVMHMMLVDPFGRVCNLQAVQSGVYTYRLDLTGHSPGVYRLVVQSTQGLLRTATLVIAGN